MEEIESDCTLVPHQRVKIVPEISGRIEEVFVREGQAVKKGDAIARLDTSTLETQLKGALEEKLGATAEAERFRGLNEPAGMEIALTRVRAAEAKAQGLQRDITSATLRSPIDGVVLTKDIELSRGVFVQAGADFTVVGTTESWDLQVHLQEKQVGRVEKLLDETKQVPVRFILYTHNTHELGGVLEDRSQLSQIAYPHQRENALQENAFILTLSDVQTPPDVRTALRPDLTGRASITFGRKPLIVLWARNIGQWFRLKWVW
jgi:multidrug efflux pump subunit AcrA (membrane-fusion protein)